jgi:FAD/FMN-containing dehydrogenase
MSQTRREKLAVKFREFLAPENVVDQPTSLNAYESDGLSAYRQQPLLVLLPENIEQVQQVMRVCHEQRLRRWSAAVRAPVSPVEHCRMPKAWCLAWPK